jgi:hypothetical protein
MDAVIRMPSAIVTIVEKCPALDQTGQGFLFPLGNNAGRRNKL